MPRHHAASLLAPEKDPSLRSSRGEWIERGLMRAFVKKFGQRFFFRTTHGDDVTVDVSRDARFRIAQIADQNCFRRTNGDARRLQSDLDSVRTKITLLRRMILGIDEDRVVGTRSDARLAADADFLVEVDDAIATAEHR